MKQVGELIRKYLNQSRMMQVATVEGDQPWICTVYYVHDGGLNLYWLSLPTRRHSQEIEKHNKIALAVPIKFDHPVIGIQAEGKAEVVKEKEEVAKTMEFYVAKYGLGEKFYDNFIAGKNEHCLYRFTPLNFVLFDEVTFKSNTRKEWRLH
jgi:uncharacterized protein YhbP (UPF0306 family)